MQTNIDPSEIVKFEAMASRWWDPNGAFGALHDINDTRVRYIDAGAGLCGKQVLDVGCGGGILAEAMAARGAVVTGIDMGEAPLAVARVHMGGRALAIDYRRYTAEAFAAIHPARFQVVVCMELLEHVPDPRSVINACSRLVRPGGQVFFATLNRNPPVLCSGHRGGGISSRPGSQGDPPLPPVHQTGRNDPLVQRGRTPAGRYFRSALPATAAPLHPRRSCLGELHGPIRPKLTCRLMSRSR